MAKRRDRVAAAIAAGRPIDEETGPVRTCLATRERRAVDDLIRFVAGPDGVVVPDLRRRLPGRGAWVSASFGAVALAAKRNPFPRTLKAPVRAPADLAEQVERLLRRDALGALGMARKAGALLTGFGQVASAIEAGGVIAAVQASDAAPDGVRKIGQSIRRAGRRPVRLGLPSPRPPDAAGEGEARDAPLERAPLHAVDASAMLPVRSGAADDATRPLPTSESETGETGGDAPAALPVIDAFTAAELGLAFGIERVIHAALTSGSAGDNALRRCQALARFLASERAAEAPELDDGDDGGKPFDVAEASDVAEPADVAEPLNGAETSDGADGPAGPAAPGVTAG